MSLVIGALCYVFWIVWFLCPAFKAANPESTSFFLNDTFIQVMLIFSGAVNGFGASILWVAQASYIAECAVNENKGLFNGIFWAIYMLSSIFGSILAAIVIG
mmetsp:Transcript_10640/g.7948  ORF Transcript_10640/g.7948 Transcript_10640/m.7948 type:complete len:102 (-) Transcript_10640:429-734(-)